MQRRMSCAVHNSTQVSPRGGMVSRQSVHTVERIIIGVCSSSQSLLAVKTVLSQYQLCATGW